ncbi:MAG: RHS repeat-associated core domain-containing protein [Bacteroidales bacterium]
MKAYSYNEERYGYYGYDDQGERTYKMDITFLGIWTNEQGEISDNWEVSTLMLYPNGYLNINQNGEYTKHYYADALRIASKIGTGFSGNICDSAGVIENAYPGYLSDRILKQNEVMQNELYEVALKNPSATLNFVNPYSDFCSIGSGGQETGLFFYHADHLGSTGMVTDINSQVTQGYLYAPFGEILQEYASIDNRIPKYAFNAKELDEENGMYYYSARYYAPPTFISRDPMFEKYPSISPYTYCMNNPVGFVDPTGEDVEIICPVTGNKIPYTPGMTIPEGASDFVSNSINSLNAMNLTDNGGIVLGELVGSSNMFSITNNTTSVEGTAGFKGNEAGGGTLNMGSNTSLLDFSHELFHGYQHEHGQGGASIFNEVEAYLFSDAVNSQYNIDAGRGYSSGSYSISRNYGTENSNSFNKSMDALLNGQTFSNDNFNNVVNLFKSESGANTNGVYNNYPLRRSNQTKNLLERFYPLIR